MTPSPCAPVFALLIVLACFSTYTSALECYKCSYNTFDSDNSALSLILTTLSKLSNERCQLLVDNDRYQLDVKKCPNPSPGHVYKCGKIEGEIHSSISTPVGNFDVTYNGLDRDCIEVPDDDNDFSDGCHDDVPMSEPVRNLVSETFDGLDGSDVTFNGQACYDNGNEVQQAVETGGPICPRCTHTTLMTSGNDVVDWFVETIQTFTDDSCLLENGDDLNEIDYRVCPPAPSGQKAKCGDIDGQISGRVDLFVTDVDFVLTTLQRDCVNGFVLESRNAVAFTDGCHTQTGTNAIIAPLVEESYNHDDDVHDASFTGQACFQSYFAPLMSGSGSPYTGLNMVFVSIMAAVFAYYL